MGLDNYFVVPNNDDANLEKYRTRRETELKLKSTNTPSELDYLDFKHHKAVYEGKRTINMVGGMFSGDGNDGSFRGKYYSELCDALLKDAPSVSRYFLYKNHFDFELIEAYSCMKKHHDLLLKDSKYWHEFKKESIAEGYYIGDYTIDDALDFLAMLEYFCSLDDICLIASH